MEKKIPKRSEVEKQYTWATEDLYKTDELWFESLENAKKYISVFNPFFMKNRYFHFNWFRGLIYNYEISVRKIPFNNVSSKTYNVIWSHNEFQTNHLITIQQQ